MSTIILAVTVVVIGFFINRCLAFYQQIQATRGQPGFRTLLSPQTLLGNLVPANDVLNPQLTYGWRTKRYYYDKFRSSIITLVAFNSPQTIYSISNPEAVRILTTDRRRWAKPVESYRILALYGDNVLTTEGEEWRKHRKIVAPGFSEKVFDLVWRTSTSVVHEMMEAEGFSALKPNERTDIKDITHLTIRLALAVLATASFGSQLKWSTGAQKHIPSGHTMTMADAITTVSEKIIWLLLAPKAVFKLPIAYLQHIKASSDELLSFMTDMIRSRRSELAVGAAEQRYDLFNQLIENSGADMAAGEKGEGGLKDDELVGNIFIFALAGHETSAHSLAFAFAYLALYPRKQQWLREEVMQVMPDGHAPSYKDFPRLERCLAVLYETLRLHPAVTIIPKVALEDTYLPDDSYPLPPLKESKSDTSTPPEQRRAFIPKGSHVHIDTTALHLHPSHWADPMAFKPARFLEDYNKDAFLPFSAGARACIGRRFAEVESVCILALMVRTFDITPVPTNESFEHKRERLLAAANKLTLTPKKALPLRLIKRDVGNLDWNAAS